MKKKKNRGKNYIKKKTCHLSVFVLLTHQTAKTHKKKKNSLKIFLLSIFELVRYQNTKMYANYQILRKETILTEMLCLSTSYAIKC